MRSPTRFAKRVVRKLLGREPARPVSPPPPPPKEVKVFCIGLNKTATTSFGVAMKHLGYKTWTWHGMAGTFVMNWHEGRFTAEMQQAVDKYDAFEDLPWPLIYKEVDERVPNAKYVLTLRASPQVWLQSIQKHFARGRHWVGHFLVYGSYDPAEDADLFLRKYIDHESEVREYFASRPDKLLVLNVEDADAWQKLCDFLGILDVPAIPFPHANPAPVPADPSETTAGSK